MRRRCIQWLFVVIGSHCSIPVVTGQWTINGEVDDWEQSGWTWTLSADAAGASYIQLFPSNVPTDDSGLSCRIRWKQDLSGSGSNFSRLHWLTDSGVVAIDEWQHQPAMAPGSFFHLGETGANDSLRWFSLAPAKSSSTFLTLSPTSNAHFPEAMELQLEWHQPPDSDTAWVGIRRMDADAIQPALCFLSTAAHPLPQTLAFSAEFTSSHTADFELEVLEFGPYAPDILPPKVYTQELQNEPLIRIQFDEPIAANLGAILHSPSWDSVPYNFDFSLNQIEFLPHANWEIGQSRTIQLSGFCDLAGNEMNDTLLHFHRTHPLINEPGDLIFTEIVIQSVSEGEWVELLNTSNHAVRLADLKWRDGSTSVVSNLQPLNNWDGVLESGGRAVLICSEGTAPLVAPYKAQIQSNGTFHNSGESLQLLNSNEGVLSELKYTSEWWNSSNEGIHLQKRYLSSCNIQSNWLEAAENTSSPGTPSSDEQQATTADTFYPIYSLPLGPRLGETVFSQPLNPKPEPQIDEGCAWLASERPRKVRWELHSATLDDCWLLRLSNVASCLSHQGGQTAWPVRLNVQAFPVPGDLVITEIAHDPRGLSEQWGSFVEVLNASSKTIELAGVEMNGVVCNSRIILQPDDRFCFESVELSSASGKAILKNASGDILHEVSYRACWHRDRSKENAGFSLVRLHTKNVGSNVDCWRDWDSSSDERGCSFASPDASELIAPSPPSKPDAAPVLCGEFEGHRILLFSEAKEGFRSGWIPLEPEVHGSWLRLFEPQTVWSDLNPITDEVEGCPPTNETNFEAQLTLNEVRRLRTNGTEPFIEIANSSDQWGVTTGWKWSTKTPAFPDDWSPLASEVHWYIPPYRAVAWARCPNRIKASVAPIPAELPSLWSSFSLQLAHNGEYMDLVSIEPEAEAPWHSLDHSLERTSIAQGSGSSASWKSSSHASGHTAGEWNSWQLHDPISSIQPIVALQDTWHVDETGAIQPIRLQIKSPGEGAWEVKLKVVDGNGTDLRSFHNESWAIQGETAQIVHWDGLAVTGVFTPGTYWVLAQFQSLNTSDIYRYTLPIHLSSH